MRKAYCALISTLAVLVVLAAAPTPAQADTLTYGSLTTWEAAISGSPTTDTFNSLNGDGNHNYSGHTINGVTFTSSADSLYAYTDNTLIPMGTGVYLDAYEYPYVLTITLGTPETAAGLNLALLAESAQSDYYQHSVDVTAYFLSGASTTYTVNLSSAAGGRTPTAWDFWGITSSDPVTSLVLAPPNLYSQYVCDGCYNGFSPPDLLFDNFSTASIAPVPEPASIFLLGTGLFGLFGLGLLRHKRFSA